MILKYPISPSLSINLFFCIYFFHPLPKHSYIFFTYNYLIDHNFGKKITFHSDLSLLCIFELGCFFINIILLLLYTLRIIN